VSRPSQDLEVSRAPRELGATVRRGLIGLVLLLIAFAGVKQVIWNPLFGRAAGTAAAGPTGMDQVAASGAATKYALDYLSYSPAGAGAAATALTADVVAGGDAAPPRWAGSGYLHADTAVPGSWHVVDASHAVVSVTVRVHLAMPSTQPTTTTAPTTPAAAAAPSSPSSAAAPPTPTKRTPTSIPTATKPGTAAKRPRPGKTTAAPKPPAAALVAPAAAYLSASPAAIPAPETTAEVGTAAVPSGSASDPGAVPAGWTDLGSRWLTLAVPVQSNAGGVKVSPSGAVLSGEAPNLVTADPAWLADPGITTATQPVVTSFFPAYAQSNAGYLAEPGVDLAGLAGTVTVASVTGWNVLVPPAPVSGAASAVQRGRRRGGDLAAGRHRPADPAELLHCPDQQPKPLVHRRFVPCPVHHHAITGSETTLMKHLLIDLAPPRAAAAAHTAALPTFATFGSTIMTILGSIFLVVLVVRMFSAWVQKQWGEFVTEFAAAIFIGWFIFDSTSALSTIQGFVKQIFG